VNFKYVYLVLLCLVFKLNIAQVYFNNRYDNYNSCDLGLNITNYNTHYINVGITCNGISFYALNLTKVNLNGSVSLSKTYYRSANNFSPNLGRNIIMPNNDFIIGGARFYKTDTSLVFLWRFNQNLDSIKYFEYGYLNKKNQVNSVLRSDRYIFMTGFVDSLYKNSDILLIKTDTSGNEIWKKKIGLPNYDETAYCIKQCANSNLLIAGLKQLHGTSTQGPFVMRIDTSGSILWQNFYPSATYANGSFDVVELPNGDIVFTGGKAYAITAQGTLRRPMLTKVDAGGNLIWQKEYGEKAVAHDFFTFLLNEKNNFVVSGVKAFIDNSCNGMVYEINQNGDSLFSREYAVQPGSQNYFRDLVQAPDKGYVFSGFISPLFANGGTGNQDIWLLKTDSTFCEAAFNCGYPTSIAEAEALEAGEMNLMPNPTNGLLNISSKNDFEKIELLSLTGQVLLSETVSEKHLPITIGIQLQNFADGIYFVKVSYSNGLSATKKIVVNR
jgi:hypothetical protein